MTAFLLLLTVHVCFYVGVLVWIPFPGPALTSNEFHECSCVCETVPSIVRNCVVYDMKWTIFFLVMQTVFVLSPSYISIFVSVFLSASLSLSVSVFLSVCVSLSPSFSCYFFLDLGLCSDQTSTTVSTVEPDTEPLSVTVIVCVCGGVLLFLLVLVEIVIILVSFKKFYG